MTNMGSATMSNSPAAMGSCEDVDAWVVVPAYNEAPVVGAVVGNLLRLFQHVVCVDDASTDSTADVAAAAGAVVLRHGVNLGQGAALQTGIDFALSYQGTKYVVTFDADGQHCTSDASSMLRLARSAGVDVVLGSRFLSPRPSIPWTRRLVLRGAVMFTRATTGLPLSDAHNGLRVLNRNAASRINIRLHRMAHASEILGIIAKQQLSFVEHPVSVQYTDYSMAKGQSNLNAVNIAFDLLLNRLQAAG